VSKYQFSVIVLAMWACLFGVECAGAEPVEQNSKATLQPDHTVTGTLAMLDVSAGKGMLKTDLNKPIFFKISRPDLFEHLSISDRVTMQIDNEGRAIKVIKALPAELHEPPPPPQ
jgi:hypothetical protein